MHSKRPSLPHNAHKSGCEGKTGQITCPRSCSKARPRTLASCYNHWTVLPLGASLTEEYLLCSCFSSMCALCASLVQPAPALSIAVINAAREPLSKMLPQFIGTWENEHAHVYRLGITDTSQEASSTKPVIGINIPCLSEKYRLSWDLFTLDDKHLARETRLRFTRAH